MKCPVVLGAVTKDVTVTYLERVDLVWMSLSLTQEVENFLHRVTRGIMNSNYY